MSGFEERFGGIHRLFGRAGCERLRAAHVCVVGLGGVGSWAVEALARSGMGQLTLVDFDEICITNSNRQLHALAGNFGRPKVDVMAHRIRSINPDCPVNPVMAFYTAATAEQILAAHYDYVVDAIDDSAMKCHLIAQCRARGLPVIVSGGAGGRRDPTQVRIADLAFSSHDGLLEQVRSRLRKEYHFPRGREPFGVDCVFSTERAVYPADDGSVCAERPDHADLRLDCHSGFGTASFVTGAFGFALASQVVRRIAETNP